MGRHGGINILHQKSWHVWRMDNRLTVERDERQHAAEEEERKRAGEQAAFSAKVARMRRRAETGVGDQQQADACLNDTPEALAVTGHSAGSSHGPADQGKGNEDQIGAKSKGKKDAKSNEYKYGAVTLSNLKLAERDLDRILARRPPAPPERGREGGGLGGGPHINLFEEAERANGHHASEHEKQLEYTKINNELAGKSAKRQMSEFDEIMCMTPWYMRPPEEHEAADARAHAGREDCQGSALANGRCPAGSRSRSPRRVWSTAHGQAMVQVKHHRRGRTCELRGGARRSEEGVVDLELDPPHGKAAEEPGVVVEEPRKRKERRKESGREKKLRERDELHALRLEREARERAESDRAERLCGRAW